MLNGMRQLISYCWLDAVPQIVATLEGPHNQLWKYWDQMVVKYEQLSSHSVNMYT